MSNNTIKTIERNGRTYAKITDLKVWDKNPREIKPEKLRLLCEDLKRDIDIVENGQFKPLIVMKNGIVIGGNMRLQAMRRLGMAEAWVSVINTTDEKRAFDIATRDNMMYGDYDEDQTAEVIAELGIDIKTLERLSIASENNETILSELVQPEQDPEVEEDEAPEVKEEPKSKLGEVYVLGGGRLMCGDSTSAKDVATLMDGAVASMVFTDPPYNVNYSGKGKKTTNTILNDNMDSQNFYNFLLDAFANVSNHTEDKAAVYVCFSQTTHKEFQAALEDNGFYIKSEIIWVKPSATMWWQEYRHRYEPIFFAYKSKDERPPFYGDRKNTSAWQFDNKMTDKERVELAEEIINAWNEQSDIWEESRESVSEYEHPTTKPVRLPSKAILNSSKTGDIVLDLFGGSGSTMSACEQTGRIPYIMELDPRYCDVIRRRYWKLKTGVEDGWEEGTRVTNKPVEKIV